MARDKLKYAAIVLAYVLLIIAIRNYSHLEIDSAAIPAGAFSVFP